MKTLNLNEYGVAELNVSEMRQTDGGFIGVLIVVAACLVAGGCATIPKKKSVNPIEKAGSTVTN